MCALNFRTYDENEYSINYSNEKFIYKIYQLHKKILKPGLFVKFIFFNIFEID